MTGAQFDTFDTMTVEQLEAWQSIAKTAERDVSRSIEVLEKIVKDMTATGQIIAKLIVAKKLNKSTARLRP